MIIKDILSHIVDILFKGYNPFVFNLQFSNSSVQTLVEDLKTQIAEALRQYFSFTDFMLGLRIYIPNKIVGRRWCCWSRSLCSEDHYLNKEPNIGILKSEEFKNKTFQ